MDAIAQRIIESMETKKSFDINKILEDKDRWLNNRILKTDSYKTTQWKQYPDNTEFVTSYIEARGGKFDICALFNLQSYLIEMFSKPLTVEEVEDAYEFLVKKGHNGQFNYDGFMKVAKLGYWPIEIKAIPEGILAPKKTVLCSIKNTLPGFGWLVSFFETSLLRAVWYPSTV